MSETVLIVGAGHAAGQCIATLKQKNYQGQIILVGEEPYLPYQRPPLSKAYLAGELDEKRLYFKPENFYDDPQIERRLGERVVAVNREKRTATLSDDWEIHWDKLVLATGSVVRRLQLPGSDLDGIHYLRSIDDVRAIKTDFTAGRKLLIVGAGYIGLEVAAVAVKNGLDVSVIEMENRVMSRAVAPEVSDFYQRVHREHGVKLILDTGTTEFTGDATVRQVNTSAGTAIDADVVIVGVGVVPNVELAENAGLACDNGIVVDEFCATADERIFAIGDCTNHPNTLLNRSLRLESVPNALGQGRTAALSIVGEPKSYNEVPWFWSDQYDYKLQIAGISAGYDTTVVRGDPDSGKFANFYLRDKQLIAVDAINSPAEFMLTKKIIGSGAAPSAAQLQDSAFSLKQYLSDQSG